jgi:putative membrane protein
MHKKRDLSRISRFIFTTPKPYKSFAFLLPLSAVISYLSVYTLNYLFLAMFIFIYSSSVVVSVIQKYITQLISGRSYLRRSSFLTVFSYSILLLVILVGIPFSYFFNKNIIYFLLAGIAIGFWFQIITNSTTATSYLYSAVVISSVYFIILTAGIVYIFSLFTLIPFIIYLFIISLIVSYSTYYLLSLPFKKIVGEGKPALLKYMLDYITEESEDDREIIENFFTSFSRNGNVNVATLLFRNSEGNKASFIIPSVHPGPFYRLGASDIPRKLYNRLKEVSENIFVFHSASSHADNMAVTDDCSLIASSIKKDLADLKFQNYATRLIEMPGSSVKAIRLGDVVLYFGSRYPEPTDDVDKVIGDIIDRNTLEKTGIHGIYIDCHNSFHKSKGRVKYGTDEADVLIRDTDKIIDHVLSEPLLPFRFAASKRSVDNEDSIAPMGIQLASINVGTEIYGLLLIDGNNIDHNAYEKIATVMEGSFSSFEILTTDNHYVNATSSGFNPVNAHAIHTDVLKGLIDETLKNMGEMAVGVSTITIKNIRLFGDDGNARLEDALTMSYSITGYALISNGFLILLAALLFVLK